MGTGVSGCGKTRGHRFQKKKDLAAVLVLHDPACAKALAISEETCSPGNLHSEPQEPPGYLVGLPGVNAPVYDLVLFPGFISSRATGVCLNPASLSSLGIMSPMSLSSCPSLCPVLSCLSFPKNPNP